MDGLWGISHFFEMGKGKVQKWGVPYPLPTFTFYFYEVVHVEETSCTKTYRNVD